MTAVELSTGRFNWAASSGSAIPTMASHSALIPAGSRQGSIKPIKCSTLAATSVTHAFCASEKASKLLVRKHSM